RHADTILYRSGDKLMGAGARPCRAGHVGRGPVGADQQYEGILPWARLSTARQLPQRGGFAVMDRTGTIVATLTTEEGQTSQRHADTILYRSGDKLMGAGARPCRAGHVGRGPVG
ncbi:hypothetical protein CTI14_54505, partial [Methylobacterium radiotolerans]